MYTMISIFKNFTLIFFVGIEKYNDFYVLIFCEQ